MLPLVRVAPGGSIDDRWTTCGGLERRGAVARVHEVPRSFGGELFLQCCIRRERWKARSERGIDEGSQDKRFRAPSSSHGSIGWCRGAWRWPTGSWGDLVRPLLYSVRRGRMGELSGRGWRAMSSRSVTGNRGCNDFHATSRTVGWCRRVSDRWQPQPLGEKRWLRQPPP